MVAGLIVSIGVIPVFDMLSQANRAISSVEDESIAFGLATEMVEVLHSLPYESLRYPMQRLRFLPEEMIEEKGKFFQTNEVSIKSFETGQDDLKEKIEYEPAEDFARFQRRVRIYKATSQSPGVRVRVEILWESVINKGSGAKSSVFLEFMAYP